MANTQKQPISEFTRRASEFEKQLQAKCERLQTLENEAAADNESRDNAYREARAKALECRDLEYLRTIGFPVSARGLAIAQEELRAMLLRLEHASSRPPIDPTEIERLRSEYANLEGQIARLKRYASAPEQLQKEFLEAEQAVNQVDPGDPNFVRAKAVAKDKFSKARTALEGSLAEIK